MIITRAGVHFVLQTVDISSSSSQSESAKSYIHWFDTNQEHLVSKVRLDVRCKKGGSSHVVRHFELGQLSERDGGSDQIRPNLTSEKPLFGERLERYCILLSCNMFGG